MPKRFLWIGLLLAALGFLGHPAGTASARPSPSFTPSKCPFRVPQGMPIDCGYLTVPEQRAAPNGPQIRLAVAIARAPGAARKADPVLYLAGGPGSAAVASTPTLARGWALFLAQRDLVVVDQRGTGFSEPSLACPEHEREAAALLANPGGPAARVAAEHAALMRCRDRLAQAGVRLAAYTTAASADDLRDLRVALGYQQWNVFGISYGTRLALAAQAADPQGVRSLILDSVYPPQVNLFAALPANLNRSLGMLFAGCAAQAACKRAYPDLEATFARLVARLDAKPVTLRLRDPRSGARLALVLDGGRLVEVIFRSLYRAPLIPHLPQAIATAAAGNYSLIGWLETERLKRVGGHSPAMYYAVECASDLGAFGGEQRAAVVAAHPRLASFLAGVQEMTPHGSALCAAWGIGPPPPSAASPAPNGVPALLLAGEYDPITPPEWAKEAAAALPKSEVYQFAGTGHAVITRGACPLRMINAFLERFSAAEAAACRQHLPAVVFTT